MVIAYIKPMYYIRLWNLTKNPPAPEHVRTTASKHLYCQAAHKHTHIAHKLLSNRAAYPAGGRSDWQADRNIITVSLRPQETVRNPPIYCSLHTLSLSLFVCGLLNTLIMFELHRIINAPILAFVWEHSEEHFALSFPPCLWISNATGVDLLLNCLCINGVNLDC